MPVYEFTGPNGEVLEIVAPVAMRDQVAPPGFQRVTVPRRLNVCFSDAPPTQELQVRNGLYDLEQRVGLSKLEHDVGWSANELKRIWADDERN